MEIGTQPWLGEIERVHGWLVAVGYVELKGPGKIRCETRDEPRQFGRPLRRYGRPLAKSHTSSLFAVGWLYEKKSSPRTLTSHRSVESQRTPFFPTMSVPRVLGPLVRCSGTCIYNRGDNDHSCMLGVLLGPHVAGCTLIPYQAMFLSSSYMVSSSTGRWRTTTPIVFETYLLACYISKNAD